MLLYHFTAREYLDAIRAEGLTKGGVPLAPDRGVNAVWLTTDRSPDGHGLSDGYTLSDEQRLAHARAFGWTPPEGARVPNKRAVRITVQVPRGDRNLRHWPGWAKKRLTPEWYATLDRTGGRKARDLVAVFRGHPAGLVQECRGPRRRHQVSAEVHSRRASS